MSVISGADREVDLEPGLELEEGASPEHRRGAGAPAKGNRVSRSLVQISEVLLLVQEIPGYAQV